MHDLLALYFRECKCFVASVFDRCPDVQATLCIFNDEPVVIIGSLPDLNCVAVLRSELLCLQPKVSFENDFSGRCGGRFDGHLEPESL